MVIRLAEVRDIPGLISLLYQVGEVHHRIRPDIFRSGAIKYTTEALEGILKDPTRPIFVAHEGGTLVGYCFCQLRAYTDGGVSAARKELYIDDLCVDEARRRTHVGSVLYRHACTWAKEQGCKFLTLNVWCGNDSAVEFYRRAGLTPRSIMMETELC